MYRNRLQFIVITIFLESLIVIQVEKELYVSSILVEFFFAIAKTNHPLVNLMHVRQIWERL